MKPKSFSIVGAALAFALCGSLLPPDRASAAPAEETQQDMEVLTRGPVHEAFAGTVNYNPTPGLVVKKEPPAAIEERPPDQQPEGDNVTWIPGYWAWDDDTNDFLWVSGIWRNLPPGRQWVPGYWNPVDDGYQWISGYWSDAESAVTDYLPEPPESLETGPSVAAPSRNHVWAPGYWSWYEERYAWTPGYWMLGQPNWVWIPGHYIWTPRGYVFVRGYWDYPVARRGVLFAPVYFRSGYYSRPDFYYSPATVISLTLFLDHLFLRPRYCHYYYGDYYAPRYRDFGYFASYSYYRSRRGYDPIFTHRYWRHRDDRNWLRDRERTFLRLRDNEALRPARTLSALRTRGDAESLALATPLDRYAKDKKSPYRFKSLNDNDRQRLIAQRQETREFGMKRKTLEAAAKGAEVGTKRTKPEQLQIAGSPIRGRAVDKLGKGEAPPKLPPVRKPVLKPEALESTVPGQGAGAPGRREVSPSRKDEAPGAREPGDTGSRRDEAPGRREVSPSRRDEAPGQATERVVPKAEPRVVPKPEPRPAPKAEPRVVPKPEPRPAPKAEPRRVAPKPEPQRVVPKAEPRPAPKPAPRAEPRPAPRAEPRPAPRPTPRAEPRPAPRAEPRPAPKATPQKGQRQSDEQERRKNP